MQPLHAAAPPPRVPVAQRRSTQPGPRVRVPAPALPPWLQQAGCPAAVPVPRPRSSHVVAFKQAEVSLSNGLVRLPVQGQELLGLRAGDHVKDSEVNTLYERLYAAPVESGYSALTLYSRLEVLELVRHDIISSKGRTRDHHHEQLTLPTELLPGAIALLTEVGHSELVLSIGEEILASPEAEAQPDLRRDTHLSLALANCGLASERLEVNNQIAAGCSYLEAALKQLQAAGEPPLAPALRLEIQQGLVALRVQGALEQLSGAVSPAKAEGRKRALRTVREAIKQQADAAAGGPASQGQAQGAASQLAGVRSALTVEAVEKLMTVLTAEEVVHLVDWEQVARNPAQHTWLYPGLLEAVAVAHVVHGFGFRQPVYVKMALALLKHLPAGSDLSVVAGVSHLLLGALDQAAEALTEAERLGYPQGSRSGSRGVADALQPGALPPSRDAYRFVVSHSDGGDDGLLPGLCVLTELWLVQAAFPFFRNATPAAPDASLVRYFDDTRVETLLTVYDAKESGAGAEQLGEALLAAFEGVKRGIKRASAAASAGVGVLAAEGAADASPAAAAQRQLLFRALAGGAVLAAVLVAGLTGAPLLRRMAGGAPAGAALAQQRMAPVAGQPVTVAADCFDTLVAAELLRQWQVAKAGALGAEQRTEGLRGLLAEPLLSETLDKVATLQSHGCHMRYKLARLQVKSVQLLQAPGSGRGGAQVRIEASLEETAALHEADGKQLNSARHKYGATYTAVQGRDGAWRVSSASIEAPAA